jgi:hypothetical protein
LLNPSKPAPLALSKIPLWGVKFLWLCRLS